MALDVPSLADEVVRLRVPGTGDVDAITDACQDPEIPRYTRVPSPYTRADAEGFVALTAVTWRDGTSADFLVVDPSDDALLGAVGLMRLDDERTVAEIGYWVAKPARRRGVATRAVRLVSRWGALELGVRRIELMTRVDNVASQRVAEAAGFTREGVLRDHLNQGGGLKDAVMFSLLPRDLA